MTAVDQRSIHHGFAVNPDLTQHKGESEQEAKRVRLGQLQQQEGEVGKL